MCNTCQAFLKMIMIPGWQGRLYKQAEKEINGKYSGNYNPIYQAMRDMGEENYTVDDMDISAMHVAVAFGDNLVRRIHKETLYSLRRLKKTRGSLLAHSNGNEDEEDLCRRALLALCELRSFIETVDNKEMSIPDSDRKAFRKKYGQAVDELEKILDNERIGLLDRKKEIAKDIKRIKDSKDVLAEYIKIDKQYFDQMQKDENSQKYFEFVMMASEEGIIEAHASAALALIYNKDFTEAEHKLVELYNEYDHPELPNHVAFSIVNIVNELQEHNYSISEAFAKQIEEMKSNRYHIERDNKSFKYIKH